MNDQAKNWVWDYEKNVAIICKMFFRQDSAAAEDMAHDVLVKLSQKDGLDQVRNRSAWISMSARNECRDYFRKLKRNRAWKARLFEDPGVGVDEKLSDAKLDKQARGPAEDIESETDEPEKIDPAVKCWLSFERRDPDRAAALTRSSSLVKHAFNEIRWWRDFFTGIDQDVKLIATLYDAKQMMEKIFDRAGCGNIMGTCTDQDIKKYAEAIGTKNEREFAVEVVLQYHIRQLIESFRLDEFLSDVGIKKVAPNGAKKPDYTFQRASVPIDLVDYFLLKGVHWHHYRMRIRDFMHVDPDPLYVLYRVWNRILRKGREGKYGNRKLLEVLLFAFQKIAQQRLKHNDTLESVHDDTFNSLTEETNLETLRVMSYRLNKGYSELADFIFEISIHPPSRAQFKKNQAPAVAEIGPSLASSTTPKLMKNTFRVGG